jgi:hypothetical protein
MSAPIDWPTILRARARELRERANAMPNTEGGTHALKIAEELGRLCNVHAPKAKHAASGTGAAPSIAEVAYLTALETILRWDMLNPPTGVAHPLSDGPWLRGLIETAMRAGQEPGAAQEKK